MKSSVITEKITRATPALFMFAMVSGIHFQASGADDAPGLVGIQYGSDDLKRPQRIVKLDDLNQRWSERDEFGAEWSGRWWGFISAPVSGNVRFNLVADHDAVFKISGKVVLETKTNRTAGQIPMEKGEKYPIELIYVKDGSGHDCQLKLQWSWAGGAPAVMMKDNLSHSAKVALEVNRQFAWAKERDESDRHNDRPDLKVGSRGFVFHKRPGEMDITIDGKPFATYVWSDPKTTRPYFKQVHALGGEIQLTRNHPPQPGDFTDHETYHPGIWWGFGDVDGNDYWRMKAKVIGGYFLKEPSHGQDRASFTVRNRMLTSEGTETFCYQVCRYDFVKRPFGILMVCESTMTREESDFWLGDQEEMGLAFRVATPIAVRSGKGGVIRDSEGRRELKQIRTNQSDWCDFSGPIEGKYGGIVLMNDPLNFRKPWWHAVDNGQLVANPLGESELSGRGKKRRNVLVRKGQPFQLRYGVLLHLHDSKDEFDPHQAYADFLKVLPSIKENKTSATRNDLPQVPNGFDISIFAQEPEIYKPTAICFDTRGRLMVGQGPQYPKNFVDSPTDSVVLVLDSDNDGVADETKTFATGFNSIQGLAWKGDDLYVANAPELTVVRDLDGDDEADEYVVIFTDLGNREHALHGLNFGPDGKLYMSKGNSKGHNQPEKYGYVAPRPFRELWDVVHPPGAPDSYPPKTFTKHNYQKTYHHWDDDWGREGGVLRCDPLGGNLEIVSRGMRNPWDITMDDEFNWLGTDNDQDQGDRIIMPFFGAHFGWGHSYSSHWTGENHLPTAPISGPVFPGSGTGIIFYAHPHFPAQYREVFFINDWLHGTFVYRPTWDGALMKPQGARWKPFVTRGDGKMLYRPTDLEFGSDGSIYICGWGGDYHYDSDAEGSWIFRVTHDGQSTIQKSDRSVFNVKHPAERTFQQLLNDLGPEVLPVRRVSAQDELVRRGESVRDALMRALQAGALSQGQQTWCIWALGRIGLNDLSIDEYMAELIRRDENTDGINKAPLNARIQALRILAYRIRERTSGRLPDDIVASTLSDPEPRIRFEAVQAIFQASQTDHVPTLIRQLASEQDRIVYYAGWRTLQNLHEVNARKQLLRDENAGIRVAALLSLLEDHELRQEEVFRYLADDSDVRFQTWALTWTMNPRPPKKMPNTTARVELEESVSIRDLMKRANQATDNWRLRQLYLSMISRATYEKDDWKYVREFFESLSCDDERALVMGALAKEAAACPLLWEALAGNGSLRQSAIQGFSTLSYRPGNTPEAIADFILGKIAQNPHDQRVHYAIEALEALQIPPGWKPSEDWDVTFAQVFEYTKNVRIRAKILTILLAIDPPHLRAQGEAVTRVLAAASHHPVPQLYTPLLKLNPRLGITVQMQPPRQATIDEVLSLVPNANAERGRNLFFSNASGTACASCHRISGRGSNLAPDLSGIGIRSEPKKIAESIVDPNATITAGYERQIFVTSDGRTVAGAVSQETEAEIRLVNLHGTLEVIDVHDVESRRKTRESAMPSGFELLGNEQVADLVAYLQTCRHGSELEAAAGR